MIMDNRLMVARRKYDPDATRYINAVQLADGQALEPEVAMAVDAFVRGCKADSAGYAGDPTRTVWDALQACCILCGARTISGALVPLVGAAPTPYNFASGDYDRSGGGLKGDGSTKYLDSNRNNNADPQDDNHNSVWISSPCSANSAYIGSDYGSGANSILPTPSFPSMAARCRTFTVAHVSGKHSAIGLAGINRNSASGYVIRAGASDTSISAASTSVLSGNTYVFARNVTGSASIPTDARLAFYSIGSSLDLAALDNRVTTLVAAIAAAL